MARLRPLSRPGLIGAVTVGSLAVLPSLIPRAGVIQGLLLGSCAAIGYAAAWWVRDLPAGRRDVHWGLLPLVALVLGWRWQAQVADLTGTPHPGPVWILVAATSAIVVFGIWLLLGRGVRWVTETLAAVLGRLLPVRFAAALAVAVTAGLLVSGVLRLPEVAVAALHGRFVAMNAVQAGPAPSNRYVSGGPASAIPWPQLGNQGQQFISGVTSSVQLQQFNGRPALAPIRAFVGVDSADTDEARAALAVQELERLGGFRRAAIAIGTSAGSGTVDNGEVVPLEYLLNGDVATVSTQYSVLPSFLSFLVDQPNATRAAQSLLAAVRERAQQMRRPPRILVFGESLGAYGSSSAFTDLPAVLAQTDGAMWQGPPSASPLWSRYTADRDPGSPQVQPVYDGGRHLRWANTPAGLSLPHPWQPARVVFLQNATDPVVWWSPRTLWSRPQWLAEPRGPGVLPWLPWLPVITFAGLTGDLINSQGVPPGHGHVYGTDPVYAWSAILQPRGWTATDTDRLAQQLR